MFAQIEYPEKLLPEELDQYLALGWFRMRQSIFTTNFLHFKGQFYPAIWLRVLLDEGIHDKRYSTLAKANSGFQSEIKKSRGRGVSAAHESLYQLYRRSVSFEGSPTLQELLNGHHSYNRFNTHEVNIYDGKTLIAVGFFDLGKLTAAGITSIYHPAYKKYSLGKYLMYLKMDHCKQQELHYFYPGYTVPGYAPFDYKLEIARSSLEYLQLSGQRWVQYKPETPLPNPLEQMTKKLLELDELLRRSSIHAAVLYYKFFEANLDPYYSGTELFDFPVFLFWFPDIETPIYHLVVYDVRDSNYHLVQCRSVINIGFNEELNGIFDSDLLKQERVVFSTPVAGEMREQLVKYVRWV
jgi:hypothetical protein